MNQQRAEKAGREAAGVAASQLWGAVTEHEYLWRINLAYQKAYQWTVMNDILAAGFEEGNYEEGR
jgi:hypothetical protein